MGDRHNCLEGERAYSQRVKKRQDVKLFEITQKEQGIALSFEILKEVGIGS